MITSNKRLIFFFGLYIFSKNENFGEFFGENFYFKKNVENFGEFSDSDFYF